MPHAVNPGRPSLQILVAVMVSVALVVLALGYSLNVARDRAALSETLANAKQFHDVVQMMTLDTAQSPPNGFRWTTLYRDNKPAGGTLDGLFGQLMRDGYLTMPKLRALMRAPGKLANAVPLTADDIAFKIYFLDDRSPADQVVLVTANVVAPRGGMQPGAAAFGARGFVHIDKAGRGGIVRRVDDGVLAEIFPLESRGQPYCYETLK